MKIHDWNCHGLSASSPSHRRTVEVEIDGQTPSATTCRANSGHDHRDNGSPQAFGGVHAVAFTNATCTGVNLGLRPDRWASPNEATEGAAHQRRRHFRTVSSHTPSDAAIRAVGSPRPACNTISARCATRCSVVPARTSLVNS